MKQFIEATRKKVRFNTNKGYLMVEDLWDLSLTNLNTLAKSLHKTLKDSAEIDFINGSSAEDKATQLQFDIVKYIIDVRLEEKTKAEELLIRKQKREKLLRLIEQKEFENLKDSSIDDLRSMLKDLES